MDILDILHYGFMQRALVTGTFVAVLCAILGLFLVLRRLSLIGDGLAHVSFGAIAVGLFLGVYPLYAAIPLVIAGSLIILALTQKANVYGDAAIGIVSSVALAGGIILASLAQGFNVDLFSYLFGNILAISTVEMVSSIILSCVVLLIISLFYWELFAVSFNEELARVSGVKTDRINAILVILTALAVVLSVRVVGVLLVSSFLILPAVTSLRVARSFRQALLYSAISAVVSLLLGVLTSFVFNLPTGATVVMVNFFCFLSVLVYTKLKAG
ncbi:metal ABC transporter permease [Patescibacteria group bacterium]|nr:metal ABC transporter permease [Patescibacteria group bacterium]MBU1472490.1 metal ABC transporter permease [Patescibacteria group bacterium]MBU2460304.1 metal ABC transporter permease [Patescibacteria group bacterium]MBU2543838.1 metal ABC transporter permease [Patescibacteria group bacterium]